MIRLAALALFCAPAYAATIPAPHMDECRPVATSPHQSIVMGQIAPHSTVWSCDWFASQENPFPISLADIKGHHETPAPLAPSVGQIVSVLPDVLARATGGTHAWGETPGAKSYAWVPPFSHTHTREPWEPGTDPASVPLAPGALLLLTALGLLWRVRNG